MYIKIENGVIVEKFYDVNKIRKQYPNTSLPKELPNELLESNGVFKFTETSPPQVDKKVKSLEFTVEKTSSGWVQVWRSVDKPREQAEEHVRFARDTLLRESDWTQGKDIPENVSTPWASYREALRNIPQQAGFPYNVEWPTPPANG
jgi:hypothetical protein